MRSTWKSEIIYRFIFIQLVITSRLDFDKISGCDHQLGWFEEKNCVIFGTKFKFCGQAIVSLYIGYCY